MPSTTTTTATDASGPSTLPTLGPRKRVALGTQPVSLTPFRQEKNCGVLCLCVGLYVYRIRQTKPTIHDKSTNPPQIYHHPQLARRRLRLRGLGPPHHRARGRERRQAPVCQRQHLRGTHMLMYLYFSLYLLVNVCVSEIFECRNKRVACTQTQKHLSPT